MSVMHPLAVGNTVSITSLVRMTRYHCSIGVSHTKVEMNEGVAALSEKARSAAAENAVTELVSNIPGGRRKREAGSTAPYRAAGRGDYHEEPCVIDGARSDSERKILL